MAERIQWSMSVILVKKMAVHSRDEAFMCKIFPSSLGPMAMRWFNRLKANSIDSFKKLT